MMDLLVVRCPVSPDCAWNAPDDDTRTTGQLYTRPLWMAYERVAE